MSVLRFKRITPCAYAPYRASIGSAGYDLLLAYDYVIQSRERKIVKTDLQLLFPEGCYGRIASRSGIALSSGIHVGACVIDIDYTGNIQVLLFNLGHQVFHVLRNDRIAQIICEKYELCSLEEVNFTERGENGFGSTGLKSYYC